MMKTLLAAFVAIVVGAAIGVVAMHELLAPQLSEAAAQRDAHLQRAETLAQQLEAAEAKLHRLQQENAEYGEALDRLDKQALAPAPPVGEPTPMEFPLPNRSMTFPGASMDAAPDSAGTRDEEETPERQREREQRRREWGDRMRGGIQEYLGQQLAGTNDPVVRDRLEAMTEYTDYLYDLRRQMAEAQTDEERQALRESMESAGQEAYGLVREQRQYLLEQAAAAAGVTDPDKQQALADAVQETLHSPFFRSESLMGRGGGPGGPSGPGGPPGQGRGRQRR